MCYAYINWANKEKVQGQDQGVKTRQIIIIIVKIITFVGVPSGEFKQCGT